MKAVIGVHFWDKQAKLSLCDAESVGVAELDLPDDIKRQNIIANDFSIRRALETIDKFIRENTGREEYALVVCVPDDTGLKEIMDLYKISHELGITVITTVTQTMAMAYYSCVEFNLEGPAMMAFATHGKLGLAQYYIHDGVVSAEDTFIAGRWNGNAFTKNTFLSRASKRFFDLNDSEIIIYSGSIDRSLNFEQAINSSNSYRDRSIEIKVIDAQCVIEGVGFICGRMERREAFMGLREESILSPYDVYVSINGQMYPMCEAGSIRPLDETVEVENYPEPKKAYDTITLYEKRYKTFVKVCQANVQKDDAEGLYHKACNMTLTSDETGRLELFIKCLGANAELKLLLPEDISTDEEAEEKVQSAADIILKFIPIIDDLEYAYKFAKDKDDPYIQGILKTYNKAVQILNENDVEVISGEGEEFDYNTQTAVAHVTDVDLPDNTVKQVMQVGYKHKGKVLRPASVIVAN